jgi:hypothetical protein
MEIWANGVECAVSLEDIIQAVTDNDFEQLNTWKNEINRGEKGDLSKLDQAACETLDLIFRNCFISKSKNRKDGVEVSQNFMGNNEEARNGWRDYYDEVIPAFQKAQSSGHLPRGFTACAALDLYWTSEAKQPLPFLTVGVIEAFFSVLHPVKDAVKEVSSFIFHTTKN